MNKKLLTPVNIAAAVLALAFMPKAFETIKNTCEDLYSWGYQEFVLRPEKRKKEKAKKEKEKQLSAVDRAGKKFFDLSMQKIQLEAMQKAHYEKIVSPARAVFDSMQDQAIAKAREQCITIERNEYTFDDCKFILENGESVVIEGDRGSPGWYENSCDKEKRVSEKCSHKLFPKYPAWYMAGNGYFTCVHRIWRDDGTYYNERCPKFQKLQFFTPDEEQTLRKNASIWKKGFPLKDKLKQVKEEAERQCRIAGLSDCGTSS